MRPVLISITRRKGEREKGGEGGRKEEGRGRKEEGRERERRKEEREKGGERVKNLQTG